MINQGLKMLKRAIDERPKGGMQTGNPKISMREADAVRVVAELEWAQHRIAELEQHNTELSATAEQLRELFLEGFESGEDHDLDAWEEKAKAVLAATPQQNLNAVKREVAKKAFIAGYDCCYETIFYGTYEHLDLDRDADEKAKEYANAKYPSGKDGE